VTRTERQNKSSAAGRRALLPWLTLLFAGSAALGAWFLIGPAFGSGPYYRVGWHRTAYEYSEPIVLLFIPWALALLAWHRGARVPLRLLIGGAVVLHLLVLFAPLPQSQDVYQYLFYGKMQAVHGANPFVVNPNRFWADPWFPWIRWNQQPSVYGPAWIGLAFAVAKAAGNHLAVAFALLKTAVFALDVAIIGAIVVLAKDRARPQHAAGWGVLAYAWNPLVLVTVPIAGSADVAVAAALLTALLAKRRGRDGIATFLLTLAALVKVYAIIALLLHIVVLARQRGSRRAAGHAAGAAALSAAAYAPYWAGWSTFHGIVVMSGMLNQSLAATVQRAGVAFVLHMTGFRYWYTGAGILVRVAGAAALVWTAVWAARRCRTEDEPWSGALVVLTVYMLVTPWFLYWYTLAPLALVAVLPRNRLTHPILTFSGTSLISFYLPWAPALWILQSLMRYGPPVAVFVLEGRRERVAAGARARQASVVELPRGTAVAAPSIARAGE
jgi:hypothetical protein